MNIADEATGAHLKVVAVDCPTVVSMDRQRATHIVNQCFKRWGLPQRIKIDNSHPFVTPGFIDIPTKSKLWWIGLGIEVIQNDLYSPQQNGIVECLQGTLNNWSYPKGYQDLTALQKRLDEESDFQRNHYQIPAKHNKTRIQIYPELENNQQKYDPTNFQMDRVYNFLAKQVWKRNLNKGGAVCFLGHSIYISYKMPIQPITITFDPIDKQWLLRKEDGTLMKTFSKGVPCEKEIKNFAICQRT